MTEIEPLKVFYPAEDYHQDYFDRNTTAQYCVYVIQPKIDKLIGSGVIRGRGLKRPSGLVDRHAD